MRTELRESLAAMSEKEKDAVVNGVLGVLRIIAALPSVHVLESTRIYIEPDVRDIVTGKDAA